MGRDEYRSAALRDEIVAMAQVGDPRIELALLAQFEDFKKWTQARYIDAVAVRDGVRDEDAGTRNTALGEVSRAFAGLLKRRIDTDIDFAWRHRLNDDELITLAGIVTTAAISPEKLPRLREQLMLLPERDGRARRRETEREPSDSKEPSILIIGAGMAGLRMAKALSDHGIQSFDIFERQESIGGVWAQTRYPGAGLDTLPHLYEYESEVPYDWSRFDADKSDVLRYIRGYAEKYGLASKCHLNTAVESMSYNSGQWHVVVRDNLGVRRLRFDIVITCVGTLNIPNMPTIDGADQFRGRVLHTATWPERMDLTDQAVGVVGNGSSGTQLVANIAPKVRLLRLFQRSPAWVTPRADGFMGPIDGTFRKLLQICPPYARWHRAVLQWRSEDSRFGELRIDPEWTGDGYTTSRENEAVALRLSRYIRTEVSGAGLDPNILIPSYPPHAKRMVVDGGYLRALSLPNVELVLDGIDHFTHDGVVDARGRLHHLDVMIFATGFTNNLKYLASIDLSGPSGGTNGGEFRAPCAYLGVAVPGLPNLLSIYGPNSACGLGGGATLVSEWQAMYIAQLVDEMVRRGADTIEVDSEACERYNRRLEEGLEKTVWTLDLGDLRYKDDRGRIVVNHCWSFDQYRALLRHPDWSHYHFGYMK